MASADVTAALASLDAALASAEQDAAQRESDFLAASGGLDLPTITTAQIRRDQARALIRGITRAREAAGALL